ncbi:MAG: site-2 protease family protein [candidate division WOR-3 bacterium]|nr:site-2 protease family protein [candidate division WOR-3 bacterium]
MASNHQREDLIFLINNYFEIHQIDDKSFVGKLREPWEINLRNLKMALESYGFIPFFSKKKNLHILTLAEKIYKEEKKESYWVNLILFLLTLLTTLLVGSFHQGGNPFLRISDIFLGIPFSFSLLAILGSHELGHYFIAKKEKVSVTLPYFLPVPHPLIGTMGAFIKMRSVVPSKKSLIRVGIAGPLTGFLVALPITYFGLKLSKIARLEEIRYGLSLGNSLIFSTLTKIVFKDLPQGVDIVLHPMAFAGWLGFFVTALNLIPLGQLDGGHIAYAIFGRFKIFIIAVLGVLIYLSKYWMGWLFWVIIVSLLSLKHPPVQDEITPLTKKDIFLAILAFVILLLTFPPKPFGGI